MALEILEIVRFERNRDGRIGPEFREAALRFGDKFRGFLPFRLGCGIRGSAGSQESVEPFRQPNQVAWWQRLRIRIILPGVCSEPKPQRGGLFIVKRTSYRFFLFFGGAAR